MQTDRDALLAGILADPDADLPRLVFADWLEETGHPANCARAEYIRLAIELGEEKLQSGWPVQRHDPRLGVLKSMFRDEWDDFDTEIAGSGECGRLRGFVHAISCRAEYLARVLREAPRHPVRTLVFSGAFWAPDMYGDDDGSVPLSLPPALHSLWCRSGRRLIQIEALMTHSPQTRLLNLMLDACDTTDDDVIRLVQVVRSSPTLRDLERLHLMNDHLTDHAAHTLAAADWPPTLRSLNIDGNRITNAGRELLFRRFGFEELRPRLALS